MHLFDPETCIRKWAAGIWEARGLPTGGSQGKADTKSTGSPRLCCSSAAVWVGGHLSLLSLRPSSGRWHLMPWVALGILRDDIFERGKPFKSFKDITEPGEKVWDWLSAESQHAGWLHQTEGSWCAGPCTILPVLLCLPRGMWPQNRELLEPRGP